jgi:hypothetical protein
MLVLLGKCIGNPFETNQGNKVPLVQLVATHLKTLEVPGSNPPRTEKISQPAGAALHSAESIFRLESIYRPVWGELTQRNRSRLGLITPKWVMGRYFPE